MHGRFDVKGFELHAEWAAQCQICQITCMRVQRGADVQAYTNLLIGLLNWEKERQARSLIFNPGGIVTPPWPIPKRCTNSQRMPVVLWAIVSQSTGTTDDATYSSKRKRSR